MQRLATLTVCTFTLLAAIPAQRGERGGRGAGEMQGPELAHYTFASGTIESDKMRRGEAGYYVLLPKGHADAANKDETYPWILWLPGFGGPSDVMRRGGAEVLDRLRGEDVIGEVALVVFRASTGRRARTTYMNGEGAGDIEDLITSDLLDTVQQRYRLSDKREHRAVMGVSAGGFGALKIAMRHPDKFGAVAVHSAAIMPADPAELAGTAESMVNRMLRGGLTEILGDPIEKSKWEQHMPMGLAAIKKPADLKGLQIYFDAGTDDHYGFFEPNQKLCKAMTDNGHKHLFREVEEGGHAWSSAKMKDNVSTTLQFVAAALAGKDAVEVTKKRLDDAAKKDAAKK